MARARDNRLTRVAGSAARSGSPATRDRLAMEAWAAMAAVVRDGLAQAGIDPAGVRALQLASDRDADPPLRSGEPLEEFVAPDSDGLASKFADRIGNIVRIYQEGREPDFAKASLAELLAWCLSRTNQPSGKGSA